MPKVQLDAQLAIDLGNWAHGKMLLRLYLRNGKGKNNKHIIYVDYGIYDGGFDSQGNDQGQYGMILCDILHTLAAALEQRKSVEVTIIQEEASPNTFIQYAVQEEVKPVDSHHSSD